MPEHVTVLGAGNMGSALARAFLSAGHSVTVWNRTSDRCAPLVEVGATIAPSAVEAIAASTVSVACVADYGALRGALAANGSGPELAGRTLVNLSTGAPPEAGVMQEYVVGCGGRYLDGAIPAYPRTVGDADEMIIFSGDPEVWHANAELLRALGGKSIHVGDDVAIANILDLALVGAFYHVAFGAFLEAVSYASALGARVADLVPLARRMAGGLLVESIGASSRAITDRDYATDQATIDVHLDAMLLVRGSMRESERPTLLMDALVDYLERARDAGRGEVAMSALFELMGSMDPRDPPVRAIV
jgi:3-hydroxyisobutyrate dehydrogenase-like beta-hydroxyacid dehydrogenase